MAKDLKIKTGNYEFVSTLEDLESAALRMGFPCVIKPVMSSSGHGQSIAKSRNDIKNSWEIAKEARGDASELIVEEFIRFDYEITILAVRNGKQTVFCDPIGHIQKDGDFVFSWMPMQMSDLVKEKSIQIAKTVSDGLGGRGVFGVELFVKGDEVFFSEVSPRPHDTGMVTMITQSASQFALHIRAILGLPIDYITYGAGAAAAYKAKNDTFNPEILIEDKAFTKDSLIRVFGKPKSHKGRRMAILLTYDRDSSYKALKKAEDLINYISDK